MSTELKHKIYQTNECISENTFFDYIDKKLSSKEEHLIEKHMLDCDLCSDAYEGLLLVKNKNRITTINSAIEKKLNPETKTIFFNFKVITSIAASIALLIVAVFLFKQYESKEINNSDMAFVKTATEHKEDAPLEEIVKDIITDEEKASSSVTTIEAQQDLTKSINKPTQAEDVAESGEKDRNETATGSTIESTIALADDQKVLAKGSRADAKKAEAPPSVNTTTSNNQQYNYKTTIDETSEEKDLKEQNSIAQNEISGGKNNNKIIVAKEEEEKNKTKTRALKADKKTTETAAPVVHQEIAGAEFSNADFDNFTKVENKPSSVSSEPEIAAEFPGGNDSLIKFISENFNYPAKTETTPIGMAKILIQFTVGKDGTITNAKVIKGFNKAYDTEALRVVNAMPKWIPAKQNNESINSVYTLPIQVESK
ncbi:MAG: energy transducer TonB [Bacteroidia bacterium]|nr:energy transducer TonB [Bacteroidia bacterium]